MEVILYRLEHEESKVGPFNDVAHLSVNSRRLLSETFNYSNIVKYPRPEDDKLIKRWIDGNEKVACKSIEQLNYWFNDFYTTLLHDGYCVVKLIIDNTNIVYGDKQVLFDSDKVLSKELMK